MRATLNNSATSPTAGTQLFIVNETDCEGIEKAFAMADNCLVVAIVAAPPVPDYDIQSIGYFLRKEELAFLNMNLKYMSENYRFPVKLVYCRSILYHRKCFMQLRTYRNIRRNRHL